MKRSILINFSLLLFVISTGCFSTRKTDDVAKQSAEKPNIVYIFADDITYKAIHATGNLEIKTPNLDKLVRNGTSFTHSYNMGGWTGAVCIASRAMLMTGKSVWHTRKINQEELAEKGEMWSQLMSKGGYETYMSGKWHGIDIPAKDLFDHVSNVRMGNPINDYTGNKKKLVSGIKDLEKKNGLDLNGITPIGYNDIMPFGFNRPLSPQDTLWQPWDKSLGGYWEGGKHWSEVLGDDALTFIDSAKNRNKPFFMYLAFNAGHYLRQYPKEYGDMYPLDRISLPKTYLPVYPFRGDKIDQYLGQADVSIAPFPRTEYAMKVHLRDYYAIITHMDNEIGRIVDAVKKSGKADNTYIIFTADHGVAVGDHGLVGKQNMYEHSLRVPFFIVGPKVPKNKKIDADIYLQDIMPTTLEIAGVQKPAGIEYNSLMPFLKGERKESFYPSIYGAFMKHHRAIRTDGFKLIIYPQIKVMRLYDLNKDPLELNDLANIASYAEKKSMLFKKLLKLQKDMDDPMDLTKFFPDFKS